MKVSFIYKISNKLFLKLNMTSYLNINLNLKIYILNCSGLGDNCLSLAWLRECMVFEMSQMFNSYTKRQKSSLSLVIGSRKILNMTLCRL